MKTLAPILLAFCCSLVSAATLPAFNFQDEPTYSLSTNLISSCGNANDLLEIKDITLTPDPPVKGQNLEVYFKGYLKEEVPEGTTVDIIVKLGVVQLLKKRFDFCQEIKKIDESCPIPQGDLEMHKEFELPENIPPGRYQVHAVITTPDLKQVTCLDGHTIFPRK